MRFCLQACTSVSSKNKTTKIIDLFIKVDRIAMQYNQISLFCSFPDPAKKKRPHQSPSIAFISLNYLKHSSQICSLNQSD